MTWLSWIWLSHCLLFGMNTTKKSARTDFSVLAQEQGFEPWHPVTGLQAFQACPFNHLGIPARGLVIYPTDACL